MVGGAGCVSAHPKPQRAPEKQRWGAPAPRLAPRAGQELSPFLQRPASSVPATAEVPGGSEWRKSPCCPPTAPALGTPLPPAPPMGAGRLRVPTPRRPGEPARVPAPAQRGEKLAPDWFGCRHGTTRPRGHVPAAAGARDGSSSTPRLCTPSSGAAASPGGGHTQAPGDFLFTPNLALSQTRLPQNTAPMVGVHLPTSPDQPFLLPSSGGLPSRGAPS